MLKRLQAYKDDRSCHTEAVVLKMQSQHVDPLDDTVLSTCQMTKVAS